MRGKPTLAQQIAWAEQQARARRRLVSRYRGSPREADIQARHAALAAAIAETLSYLKPKPRPAQPARGRAASDSPEG